MNDINNLQLTNYTDNNDDYDEDNDTLFSENNPEFVEFKEYVKEWILLDDDISTLQKAIKERREKKNLLTPSIIDFMNRFEINDLNTNNGKLKCCKTMRTKPLNKDYLLTRLSDFFRDIKKGEKALNFLMTDRPKEPKFSLKRVIAKKI
jgi:hypothetical protein